jgi:hypothetical protein
MSSSLGWWSPCGIGVPPKKFDSAPPLPSASIGATQNPPKRDGDHGLLALFWQSPHNQKRGTAMTIPAILALAFAITTGVALTTAFGFGLLPLGIY